MIKKKDEDTEQGHSFFWAIASPSSKEWKKYAKGYMPEKPKKLRICLSLRIGLIEQKDG